MKVAEVINLVLQLPTEDQKKVVNAVHTLWKFEGVRSDDKPTVRDNSDLILHAMIEVLKDLGVEYTSPAVLKRVDAYKTFKEKQDGVDLWLDKQKLSRNERHLLMKLALRLLHQNLQQTMGVPIGSRMMMTNLDRIPVVIDKAFPGYAAMGLLSAIVRGANGKIKTDSDPSGKPHNDSVI